MTVDELCNKYSISYICKVLNLHRSTYYNYLNYKKTNKGKDLKLKETILEINKFVSSTYGRNRMTIEVNKKLNTNYNPKKIRRLMRELGIECLIRTKKKRYKKTNEEYTKENILNRNFSTTGKNQKWSTDVTEITTSEGKLYVSGIIDIHSKELIDFEIGSINNNQLVFKNIKKAIEQENIDINNNNLIIQTDRGYQYTSYGFRDIIGKISHSMSRPGHCPDNSPIESFWGIFKSECIYNPINKGRFRTKKETINIIKKYFKFYNNDRITLKGTTPNEIRHNSL